MIFLFAILLYNHPTLSDSWLMWGLLLIVWGIRSCVQYDRTSKINAITKWINNHQALS